MKLLDDEFPAPREPEPLQIYTIRSDDPAENEPLATLATGCLERDPSHEGLGRHATRAHRFGLLVEGAIVARPPFPLPAIDA